MLFRSFIYLFIYLFIYSFIHSFIHGCVGSPFLCEGFLQLRQAGATLHRGAQASHHCGPSCCGAQAPDMQTQQLWLTGLVTLRHVGSSETRARTRVPCLGRQTLNHCATREAQGLLVFLILSCMSCLYILEIILCPLIHWQIFSPIRSVLFLSCLLFPLLCKSF